MNRLILLQFLIVLGHSHSFATDLSDGRWIDLSYDFSEETIYWPTAEKFEKITVFEDFTEAGYYYSAYNFCGAEHGGTHLDAPVHFSRNKNSVDQIRIEQLIGPGVIIRIKEKADANRNYQLLINDVLDWEKKYGQIEENSIVLVDTGSGKFWPDREKYMGTDKRGQEGVDNLKFPGIHPETAEFLATRRKIKAIGIDTPSIDFGGSKLFETHQTLFDKNIPGMENIANLDLLPVRGFMIIALPMKIKGGSGGPLRIVAFIPDE